jgi:PAS domain S-box-containing protein
VGRFSSRRDPGGASAVDARFRGLLENFAVPTNLVSPDGLFQFVNQAMCDMLGYDAETLLTMNWLEVTAPDDRAEGVHAVEDLLAGRQDSHRQTKRYLRADGQPVWGDLTINCVRDSDGTVEFLVGQIIDITEQVELRAKHAEADGRFRRMTETSNVAMALVAPDGKLEVVNQALCQLFGYDEETLKTKTWQEMTPASNLEADLKNTEDLLHGRLDTYRVTKEHIHADGHLFWVDLSVSCLRDAGGAVQYLVAQGIDITEQVELRAKQAEADARFRRLMETSNVAMAARGSISPTSCRRKCSRAGLRRRLGRRAARRGIGRRSRFVHSRAGLRKGRRW